MYVIGLMSGTSLDGLDVAYVECGMADGCSEGSPKDGAERGIRYRVLAAETYPYPQEWVDVLSSLEASSAYEYALAHVRLGHYFGQKVNEFRNAHPGRVDLVSSHGHTIFHQPHLALTTQIGDGDAIAAETRLPVVSNFRTFDVALGGQGAPLVPIGDRYFFSQYQACVNLGGIANISFEDAHKGRIAYDICPCNMALNHLSRRAGMLYDKDGNLARSGRIIGTMLDKMEALDFYRTPAPKSLGKEWFVANFLPLMDSDMPVEDVLRTVVEHEALRIADVLNANGIKSLLVTGGGAYNKFLIERVRAFAPQCGVVVPEATVVEYKEAIIFALLGYLRITHETNTLCSVTGAECDSIGGTVSGLLAF